MTMAIAGLLSSNGVNIIDSKTANVSYPNFWDQLSKLGAKIE